MNFVVAAQARANGGLAGEETLGHALVDDDHARTLGLVGGVGLRLWVRRDGGAVLIAEVAAGDDRDAQRLEEARADGVEIDVRLLVGLPLVALHGDVPVPSGTGERGDIGEAGGAHVGVGAHLGEQALVVVAQALPLVSAGLRADADQQHTLAHEAGVEVLQIAQAAHEEPGADQQEERDGHLRDHQDAAQIEAAAPRGGGFALERGDQVGPRGLRARAPVRR